MSVFHVESSLIVASEWEQRYHYVHVSHMFVDDEVPVPVMALFYVDEAMSPCCAVCPECASLVQSSAVWGEASAHTANPLHGGCLCCAVLCRELGRKMQLLILKLERAKCLIFGLLCVVFPIALLCCFRTIHQLSLGDPGVGSLECSSTAISSFTAVHLFSLPFLLCFCDWRFHLMQKDIWLVMFAVRSTSALPVFACCLSFKLCGYWGLKCDSTKKDDRNFYCVTW